MSITGSVPAADIHFSLSCLVLHFQQELCKAPIHCVSKSLDIHHMHLMLASKLPSERIFITSLVLEGQRSTAINDVNTQRNETSIQNSV